MCLGFFVFGFYFLVFWFFGFFGGFFGFFRRVLLGKKRARTVLYCTVRLGVDETPGWEGMGRGRNSGGVHTRRAVPSRAQGWYGMSPRLTLTWPGVSLNA